VEAVQAAATALDATDQVCTTGQGVAARTSHRAGAAAVTRARAALRALPRLGAAYRTALASLEASRTAVTGPARTAIAAVVRDGQAEAAAVEAFRVAAGRLWPQYDALDHLETLWITRAVTPWYRSAKEGSDAYAVLVGDTRGFLVAARTQLAAASRALSGPTDTQTATLAAADRALAGVRTAG
jgi:hypothetical protein